MFNWCGCIHCPWRVAIFLWILSIVKGLLWPDTSHATGAPVASLDLLLGRCGPEGRCDSTCTTGNRNVGQRDRPSCTRSGGGLQRAYSKILHHHTTTVRSGAQKLKINTPVVCSTHIAVGQMLPPSGPQRTLVCGGAAPERLCLPPRRGGAPGCTL